MAQDKKKEEKEYLDKFLLSLLGQEWLKNNDIQDYNDFEEPDFIFNSKNNKRIGIEVTQFIIKSKHGRALQHLMTIGNKVCHYTKEKHKLEISIVFDKWNRKACQARTRQEVLDAIYNPGFTDIFDKKEVKLQLERIIDTKIKELNKWPCFIKDSILIQNEYLTFSISSFPDRNGKFECFVNNECFSRENPFDELQTAIDNKNKKYNTYLNNCNECFLLIYKPDVSKGNYCHFTNKILKQQFNSKYKDVFLYDAQNNKCINLNIHN